jgi:hypothetical protein
MMMMNMKRHLTLLFAFSFVFLTAFSKPVEPIQKRLLGTWKVVKVEKYDIPNIIPPAPQNTQKSTTTHKDTTTSAMSATATAHQASKMEDRLNRIIQTEMHSKLTINADKTAIEERPGKTLKGTWKLKKHGTILLVNSKERGKKMTIDIIHVNDTSAVVIQRLPIGGLKITYRKEKK